MSNDIWCDVVDQLRSLIRLSRHLAHRRAYMYEGLPAAAFGMLGVLVRDGAMRLTALAERQAVDTSVASRQVGELVERGFVERRPDPADARAHLLAATDNGRAMAERVHQHQVEITAHILRGWDEADADALKALLTRLNTDLRGELCPAADRSGDAVTGSLAAV